MAAPIEALALHLTNNRLVELESSELMRRLTVEVHKRTSDLAVRQLLTPDTIVRLLDLSEQPLFAGGVFVEAYGGKLVIATPGTIGDADELDELLAAVAPLVTTLKSFVAPTPAPVPGATR